jgi:hypothetical protein
LLSGRNIKIRHLKCSAVNNRIAAKIADFGINLHLLILKYVSDKNMSKIAESCPKIKHLEINDYRNITDGSIFKISQFYPNIKTLKFRHNTSITDKSIISMSW